MAPAPQRLTRGHHDVYRFRDMARHTRSVNASRSAPLMLLLLALSGCGWITDALGPAPVQRGNRVDPEKLAQITPGVQTRSDVEALLGSPSARGTFDEDNWYYISAQTRLQPGRYLQVEDRRVVAIAFNRQGVVRVCGNWARPMDGRCRWSPARPLCRAMNGLCCSRCSAISAGRAWAARPASATRRAPAGVTESALALVIG